MNTSLEILLDAAGSCFDPVYQLVAERGNDGDKNYTPTWGALFDVTLCPTADLPYLGQYVGVQIPLTATDAAARQQIVAEAEMNRGTLAAVNAAVQRNISTPWAPSTAYTTGLLVTYQATPGVTTFYQVTTGFTSGSSFSTTDLAVIDPTTQYQIHERSTSSLALDAYQLTIVVNQTQLTPASNTAALVADVGNIKPGGIIVNVISAIAAPLVSQYVRNMSAVTAQLSIAALADVN